MAASITPLRDLPDRGKAAAIIEKLVGTAAFP